MRQTQKTWTALAAATVMTTFGGTAPLLAQMAPEGWISVSACAPAGPLIPSNTTEGCGSDVLNPILAGLVTTDLATGDVVNDIAQSFETTDNTVWTVTLTPGWTFHDGTPVTAASFVDAWNWTAYGPNGQATNDWFSDIVGYEDLNPKAPKGEKAPEPAASKLGGLEILGDHQFRITLKRPVPGFKAQLAYKAFFPMPAAFFADPDAFGRKPIGAGPFRMDAGSPDSGYKLSAYAGYMGAQKPEIAGIDMRIYTSAEAAYNDLVAENLDLMSGIPQSKLVDGIWKRDLDGRVVVQPQASTRGLGMPWGEDNPQLTKPEMRQAISMAIDRQTIIDVIFSGIGKPATGWVPPGVDGYKAGGCGDACVYNPEEAKKRLAAAGGYTGSMKIYYSGDSADKPAMEAICNSIRNTLGIDCLTSALADNASFRTYTRSGKADGPFPANWTMDYPSIDNAIVPIYSSTGSSNRKSYTNPAFDALIKKAEGQPHDEAVKTYREAEALLAVDLPRVPLWNPSTTIGHSPKIKSVGVRSNGRVDYTSVTLN
jgi:oligopeptide transport system substrate-binding protein